MLPCREPATTHEPAVTSPPTTSSLPCLAATLPTALSSRQMSAVLCRYRQRICADQHARRPLHLHNRIPSRQRPPGTCAKWCNSVHEGPPARAALTAARLCP